MSRLLYSSGVRTLKQTVVLASFLVAIAAILQQLQRPPYRRNWHGSIGGVPYDFRPLSLRRIKEAWWNPEDQRLFTPRDFGIGWALNLHRLSQIVKQSALHQGRQALRPPEASPKPPSRTLSR
jgi:Family of unknown function (DUF5808)